MTPDDWRRVRELFEAALGQTPTDRASWVEREAARDAPSVRNEVLSLLAHDSKAQSFLSAPLVERAPDLFADASTLAPDAIVGSYRIVHEIGHGGMGRIYLAIDTRLGRQVALKALSATLAGDPAYRERLRREAQAAAGLTHPGICTVYALEEIDGAIYIASEYVDGRTLRAEIAGDRLPSAHEVVDVARQLAGAIASAHAKRIAHRDLKPENVMRAKDGRLRVLDFGLARFEASTAGPGSSSRSAAGTLTKPGTWPGTPAYMSPEQLNGEPGDAGSDVFALGIVLFEYATGVHPFGADTSLATAGRILEREPPRLDELRPDLPAVLTTAVDRCLRKRPAERWPNALDLMLVLARAEEENPRGRLARRWWRIHQLVMMGIYCVASASAWEIKEWVHGLADPGFVAVGVASAANGIMRGHLIFTELINRSAISAERARAAPITLAIDIALATLLALLGVLIATDQPLAAMLTIALAVAVVLARAILEPATTAAAFDAS